MKVLTVLLALFCATQAMATGKLTLKPAMDTGTDEKKISLGLAIFEQPMKYMGVNAWVGGGLQEDDRDNWLKGDFCLESYIGAATLGLGYMAEQATYTQEWTEEVYAKLGVTLW